MIRLFVFPSSLIRDFSFDLRHILIGDHPGTTFHIRIGVHHEIFLRVDQGLLQIRDQFCHILVSAVRRLLTTFQYNTGYAGRDLRYKLLRRRHFFLNMLDGNGNRSLPVERNSSRQHLEHGDTQRIDITLFIAVTPSGLLGRSIVYTSHDIRSDGITGSCLGNTEVRHLDFAVLGDNNILRLDIPMDNMIIMCSLNTHAYLDGDTYRFLVRQSGLLLNVLFEGNTLYQFHDDIIDSVLFPDIIDIDNIGVHQSCCRLCLDPEFGYKISIFAEFLLQYLDRHIAIQLVTFCFIDI